MSIRSEDKHEDITTFKSLYERVHKLILRYDLDYPKFLAYLEFDSTGRLNSPITRSKKEKELNQRELLLLELYFHLGAYLRSNKKLKTGEVLHIAYWAGYICAEEKRIRMSTNKFATIVPDERYWLVRAMQMCWPKYLEATPTKQKPDPSTFEARDMRNLSEEMKIMVLDTLHNCRAHLTQSEANRGVRLTPEMICKNLPAGFKLGIKTIQRWQQRWATLMMSES